MVNSSKRVTVASDGKLFFPEERIACVIENTYALKEREKDTSQFHKLSVPLRVICCKKKETRDRERKNKRRTKGIRRKLK